MNPSTPTQTLVLQSNSPLKPQAIKQLCLLSQARDWQSTQPTTAYLHHAQPATRQIVEHYARHAALDVAFMPAGLSLATMGLLVSDMDSTLITIECIDEIADLQGLKTQVAAITERAMRGELDFARSLTERVRLLAGLPESALEQVYQQRLKLTRGAESLIAACQQAGVKFMLVSGGFTFFTERLKARLGLDYALANQLEVEHGRLTGRLQGPLIDAQAKRACLVRTREQLGLQAQQVIAVGDGANDLPMLQEAGLGIAFHAKPVVQQQAALALNHVGLDGIVRLFAPSQAV